MEKEKNNKKIIFTVLTLLIIGGIISFFIAKNCDSNSCNFTGNSIKTNEEIIVAEFDNQKITSNQLEQAYEIFLFLNGIPKAYAVMIPKIDILNQTISEEVLYQKAIKQGYSIENQEAEIKLKETISKSGSTIDELKEDLENNNISYDAILKDYKKQLVIIKFLDDILFNEIKVTEEETQEYYNNNTEEFKIPEQVRASHILVNTSTKAQEIINELNNKGNFTKLAQEHSTDPGSSDGGDLGYFAKGQMAPEFEEAAFALEEIGDYTKEPIETQFGYHIIILTGKEQEKTITYQESKEYIKEQLLTTKKSELSREYIDNLLKDVQIKIYEENIKEEKELPVQFQD